MKDSFLSAKFIDFKTIRLLIFTNALKDEIDFNFYIDDKKIKKLSPCKINSTYNLSIIDFKLEENIVLGHEYYFILLNFGKVNIDTFDLPSLKEFDDLFYFEGELGVSVNDESTTFRLWAPLAFKVNLVLENKIYEAKRINNGVYEISFPLNLHGKKYHYEVFNSNSINKVIDPYGYSSTLNSKESVVVDFTKFNVDTFDNKLSELSSYSDAIIYEAHVRDMTMDKSIPNKYKGTFLGLCIDNKNSENKPIGLNYIKSLGITHLQLLPVLDFLTVDEENKFSSYNWGYDPGQYFTLEGSYASNIEDPMSRIRDFLTFVSIYHQNDIRINLDVVFNHVYRYEKSNFEKLVPNYFFRKKDNDKMSNCSGCGNDLASEKRMVNKLICDSCVHLFKHYHIDGLRFDLMGLTDVDTLIDILEKVREINPSAMLYGEGWNMAHLENKLMGNMDNASALRNFAFFNDRFRDILKGNTFNRYECGYGLGNANYKYGMKFVFLGSSHDITYPSLFLSPNQSLNYVECHDNATLFDKIDAVFKNESLENKLKRVHFINALTIISLGIPFIHAGQEYGHSKNGLDNTYKDNSGINYFNYDLAYKRNEMVASLSSLIKLRKKLNEFNLNSDENLLDHSTIKEIGRSGLLIKIKLRNQKELIFIINADKEETLYYNLDKDYKLIGTLAGDVSNTNTYIKNAMINPTNFIILLTK